MAHHGEQPENGDETSFNSVYLEEHCEQLQTLFIHTLETKFYSFCLQASNIDDVLCHHTSFLDNCLKDCMLTNPELLRIFSKLMSVCVMYTNCMQVCTESFRMN